MNLKYEKKDGQYSLIDVITGTESFRAKEIVILYDVESGALISHGPYPSHKASVMTTLEYCRLKGIDAEVVRFSNISEKELNACLTEPGRIRSAISKYKPVSRKLFVARNENGGINYE